jgi:hypothetical protein
MNASFRVCRAGAATEARDADGRMLPRPLADAERRLDRDAPHRATGRRGVPDAVAGGGPGERLVDDSRDRLEESGPASCAADATGSRGAPAPEARR